MVLVRATAHGRRRLIRQPAGPTVHREGENAYRLPTVGTEFINVYMPPGPRQLGPTVVWCHGLFGSSLEVTPFPASRLARELVAAGMPVLVPDLGGPSTWANDDSIDAVDDAIAYGAAQFGTRTDRIALVGVSMGGSLMANWASRHITRVSWLYGLVPALNLTAVMARDPAIDAAVKAAYGGAAAWLAAQPTHDPIAAAVADPLEGLGERFRIDAALNDELFLNADYEAYLAVNATPDLRWLIGTHQQAGYRNPAEFGLWARSIVERYG